MVWEGPKDSKLILSGVGWASPQYPQALRDVSNQQVGPKGQDVFSTVFFVCLFGRAQMSEDHFLHCNCWEKNLPGLIISVCLWREIRPVLHLRELMESTIQVVQDLLALY